MIVPVLTLIKEAYQELNVFQAGASIPAPQKTLAVSMTNEIIDNWNAERAKVWCEVFLFGTLVPSLNPHTIGPTGATFTTPIRPVTIEGCSIVLDINTPNVFVPINVVDYQVYQALSVPGISTSIPQCVYYEKDWPIGKLFFYPIPSQNYQVRFTIRTLLGIVTEFDSLDLPPGGKAAMKYTLSEMLSGPSGRELPPSAAKLGREARARFEVNNVIIPQLDLRDGQQQRDNTSTNFNYHSREWNQ